MTQKVIIENTDANRAIQVFHNPSDGWSNTVTPGARVGCCFGDGQELVIRRASAEPTVVDDDTAFEGANNSNLTPAPTPLDIGIGLGDDTAFEEGEYVPPSTPVSAEPTTGKRLALDFLPSGNSR